MKRTDISSILLIGSGPIVIGQACEFDYSGTQACKALREEGYRVILVNSNPATIMTDPEFADRTYVEPLTVEMVAKVIEAERPDALLPTLGGQTALNLAVRLSETGILDKFVKLIGASIEAIQKAENRQRFKDAMTRIGMATPASGTAHSLQEARELLSIVGLPAIIRPSFTLGGTGGGVAETREEFEAKVAWGLSASPTHEVLIEQSIADGKEFELEVMRDHADNVVIICSIENLDPMGVHTGDSITVAPVQTLTDREYQRMRDAAIAIIREIGVDTGGSNIQFALDPENGEMVVIEMNPRVSRSSALASKATGYPIAKIAAKLAVGYRLDELTNDITGTTPASFEPTLDYVVVKIPRFAFEKFPAADPVLGPQMKSVGEVMAIGRTFKEAYQKALRSLENGRTGLDPRYTDADDIRRRLRTPTDERPWLVADAMRQGISVEEINRLTRIDRWFLHQIEQILDMEGRLAQAGKWGLSEESSLRAAKRDGFSDATIGRLTGLSGADVRARRVEADIRPTYKMVDTCAAEFEARTPYLYSTYEAEDEAPPTDRRKVVILGSGPNRIGQGIEFDYCCVHGVLALREAGFETIMVNCNPETVSTDYDTSDRLYFEPLTLEDVLEILDREKPEGVILQFGGQTPLKLAKALEAHGVPIWGTSPEAIDVAEDRERFRALIEDLELRQPASGAARTADEAEAIAERLGFPLLLRPSYVLGGRAMEIVPELPKLKDYMRRALTAAVDRPVLPILVDKYLESAIEVDVDAVSDGTDVLIGGVLEHIEEAGVHSGDAACSLPPHSLPPAIVETLMAQTRTLARALRVVGLINVQFAVQGGTVYVLEVNPRASRTVPFVAKATGRPLAKLAARVMAGERLRDLTGGVLDPRPSTMVAVKEAVLPFARFSGVDVLLGPEMKSTGEVMGLAPTFEAAFAKAQAGAGPGLPVAGRTFLSVRDHDKGAIVSIGKSLYDMGFELIATRGTAASLAAAGLPVEPINKVLEGPPHIVDAIEAGTVALVINTTEGDRSIADSYTIRRSALLFQVPYFTTIAGARAAVSAIGALRRGELAVRPLQDIPAA